MTCLCVTCTCTGCHEACFGHCRGCGEPVDACNSYQTEGAKGLEAAKREDKACEACPCPACEDQCCPQAGCDGSDRGYGCIAPDEDCPGVPVAAIGE